MTNFFRYLSLAALTLILASSTGRAGTEIAPAAPYDPFATAEAEPGYWVPDPCDGPVVYVDPAPVYYSNYAPYPYYYYPNYYPYYYGYSGYYYGGVRFGFGRGFGYGYGYRNFGNGGFRGGFVGGRGGFGRR